MVSADSNVRRPTTAPIMSRGPPVVNSSGSRRWRMRPTAPPAKTARPTATANVSGLMGLPSRERGTYRAPSGKATGERRASGPSPLFSDARLDEIVHAPRDRVNVEQRLDALAPRAGEIGAPVGRVHELTERRGDSAAIARVREDRARAADLGKAASPGSYERRAAGERLERGAAERLGAGGQHHADRGALPRRLDFGIGNVRVHPDPAARAFGRGAQRL